MQAQMKSIFDGMNLAVSQGAVKDLITYMELLLEWNKKMNLTAITAPEEIIKKHFADSLAILPFIPHGSKVIDVGTGAGFPGLPLKIVRPDLKVTLLDSLNKRIRFLDAVVAALSLKDITTCHARAEDGARSMAHREQYDFCLSRAVARLNILSEYCLPYVKPGGFFVAYKGAEVEEELEEAGKALQLLGGVIDRRESIIIPQSDYGRCLIFVSKISKTSAKYPRKAGVINKNPII